MKASRGSARTAYYVDASSPPRCAAHLFTVSVDYIETAKSSLLMNIPVVHHAGRRWSDGLHRAVEAKEGALKFRMKTGLAGVYYLPELLPSV